MELPVVFAGWGGEDCTDAIFLISPEYVGTRKIALFFDEGYLAEANRGVQSAVGSGFTVDSIIPEAPDGRGGMIIMHIDPEQVKKSVMIGFENRNTKVIGGEYSIAFYCSGEFDLTIVAFDENKRCEELYSRSFCCK